MAGEDSLPSRGLRGSRSDHGSLHGPHTRPKQQQQRQVNGHSEQQQQQQHHKQNPTPDGVINPNNWLSNILPTSNASSPRALSPSYSSLVGPFNGVQGPFRSGSSTMSAAIPCQQRSPWSTCGGSASVCTTTGTASTDDGAPEGRCKVTLSFETFEDKNAWIRNKFTLSNSERIMISVRGGGQGPTLQYRI